VDLLAFELHTTNFTCCAPKTETCGSAWRILGRAAVCGLCFAKSSLHRRRRAKTLTRAPKTETCGFAWRILGRGPTRQKIADKEQGVALPAASGTLVLCFAARWPQASLCLQRRCGHIWHSVKRQVKSTLGEIARNTYV
jgi:hypothetical protein